MTKHSRYNWDETFMNMAIILTKRVPCTVVKTAAVFVDDKKRVISLGYNGSVRGDYNGTEVGCAKIDGNPITGKIERCRGVHAEINGIFNSMNTGRLEGSTLYTIKYPCYDCMKALVAVGVKEIVYYEKYLRAQTGGEKFEEETEAEDLAKKMKIKIKKYKGRICCEPEESLDSHLHKKCKCR